MGEAAMNVLHQTWSWLTAGSHWTGAAGVLARLVEHLQLCGEAMLLAGVVAIPLALVLGHARRGTALVVSLANASRAVPTLAVLVLLVLRLGIGDRPVVYALALFAFPPMVTNTYAGVRGVDDEVRDAARGVGLSGSQLLRRVEVPLALPLVAAGVRTAAVQVIATATIAAIVGSGGLGRFIVDGFQTNDYGQLVSGVLVVAALAVLIEVVLGVVERRLDPLRRGRPVAA
jgi:osmoprotectant transport system permease protein